MTSEERRQATRERVRAWKEKNKNWLLKHQYKRRWQRTLATRVQGATRVRSEDNTGTERKAPREVQETVRVSMDEVEGDPQVMAAHREALMARQGKNTPPPPPPRVMEPEPEVVVPDMGNPIDPTPEEDRVTLWLESRKGGRVAPETSPQLLEIEMP